MPSISTETKFFMWHDLRNRIVFVKFDRKFLRFLEIVYYGTILLEELVTVFVLKDLKRLLITSTFLVGVLRDCSVKFFHSLSFSLLLLKSGCPILTFSSFFFFTIPFFVFLSLMYMTSFCCSSIKVASSLFLFF